MRVTFGDFAVQFGESAHEFWCVLRDGCGPAVQGHRRRLHLHNQMPRPKQIHEPSGCRKVLKLAPTSPRSDETHRVAGVIGVLHQAFVRAFEMGDCFNERQLDIVVAPSLRTRARAFFARLMVCSKLRRTSEISPSAVSRATCIAERSSGLAARGNAHCPLFCPSLAASVFATADTFTVALGECGQQG